MKFFSCINLYLLPICEQLVTKLKKKRPLTS